MNRERWGSVLIAGFTLFAIAGCGAVVVGAAAGAGAVAYVRGELKATEEAPLDSMVEATQTALKEDLRFTVTSESADAVFGKFEAHTADDRKIEINLKRSGETQTDIRIRVGVFGDEELSRHILDKIKARLERAHSSGAVAGKGQVSRCHYD